MYVSPPLLSILLMQVAPAAEPQPAAEPEPTSQPATEPERSSKPAAQPAPPQAFPASIAASVAGGLSRRGVGYHGRSGEGRLELDWYVRRPVVDDGTPFALQPYLQRANRISLGVEGSLWHAKDDATPAEYTDKFFVARLGGLFHRGWSVFGGEVEYLHFIERPLSPIPGVLPRTIQALRPSATFGVRDKALELCLSYVFTARFDDGAFQNPGWGQARARMTLVLDNYTYFSLEAFTLPDGGGSVAKYETFLSPGLGIWLGGDYQEEQINYFDGVNITVVGYAIADAEVGVEWWHSNRFALLGWLSGGMIRATLEARNAYGTETPYLQLVANLGIVTRIGRRNLVGSVPPTAY
jgi:hypothetical protein